MVDRAIVFIDGNNWYHSIRATGATDLGQLDYARISKKLVQGRNWLATRYYVGRVQQRGDTRLYSDQRRFLARLTHMDRRISAHLGRLEPRRTRNKAVEELQQFLGSADVRMDEGVYRELVALAARHRRTEVFVEKAVDVMIAVDMVVMAERDAFDTAYLLSADGDFTPAVEAVRSHDKRVFAVSGQPGAQLRDASNAFLRVDRAWLSDCYLQSR